MRYLILILIGIAITALPAIAQTDLPEPNALAKLYFNVALATTYLGILPAYLYFAATAESTKRGEMFMVPVKSILTLSVGYIGAHMLKFAGIEIPGI